MLLPIMASADAVEIGGVYYFLDIEVKQAEVTVNPNKYAGDVVIPDFVTFQNVDYSVTSIGVNAFEYCSDLTSIKIPNSVTEICSGAFINCSSLTSIDIPNSVITIGPSVFAFCKALTSVIIPNSVTSIGPSAFTNCNALSSIDIPNSVRNVGSNAFYNTPWYNNKPDGLVYTGQVAYKYKGTMPANTSISIKEKTWSISSSAFKGCSGLSSITIPSSVTYIGEGAFSGCKSLNSVYISDLEAWCNMKYYLASDNPLSYAHHLFLNGKEIKDLIIPQNVTSIGYGIFNGCSGLTSVTIPNSVTSIGMYSFKNCSGLTSINIPNSVTCIDYFAFAGCSSLCSLTIPNSVTTIEPSAFQNCYSLTSLISINSSPSKCYNSSFENIDKNTCVVWVPNGSVNAYKEANGWKEFQNIKELNLGDVNIDYEVNKEDLNAIIKYIMAEEPECFYESLADLNNDGEVNAADVVMQVDAIMKADELSKNKAPTNVEAIDLGLPKGTMWANMNIGAESPEDSGLYFAWGEAVGYTNDTSDGRLFDWASYKWMNEGQSTGAQVNKYQIADGHTADCWYNSMAEFIGDGKTMLDLEDDAAYVNWGTNWHMPTYLDFRELFENTTYKWTTLNGVNGLMLTSKINGNSIFLPAAGDRHRSGIYDLSDYGCYWSSSLHDFDSSSASFLIFNSVSTNPNSIAGRFYGFTVRPVLRNIP